MMVSRGGESLPEVGGHVVARQWAAVEGMGVDGQHPGVARLPQPPLDIAGSARCSGQPGEPFKLAAEVDTAIRSLGGDDNFQLLSASQHNPAVRQPGERLLHEGDVILAEISPSVAGQFTQICRSVVLGESSDIQRRSFATQLEAFDAGMRRATPGTPVSDVAAEMNAVLAERGYEKYNHPPYMRTRGHTMGLGALAPLDVSESNHTVLEEGMSFVLHPNQYFPECGYLLCGDQVVIRETGAHSLAARPPQLDVLEGEVAE